MTAACGRIKSSMPRFGAVVASWFVLDRTFMDVPECYWEGRNPSWAVLNFLSNVVTFKVPKEFLLSLGIGAWKPWLEKLPVSDNIPLWYER